MARRIGERTYEVAPGVIVMPIRGANERQDGWQIIYNGEYHQDYPLKRDAIRAAEAFHKSEAGQRPVAECALFFGDFSRA